MLVILLVILLVINLVAPSHSLRPAKCQLSALLYSSPLLLVL